MAKKSASVGGMNLEIVDLVKTLEQYNDIITILPNSHRLWAKALGPLWTTTVKVQMAYKSLTTMLGKYDKELEEVADTAEDGEETLDSSLNSMVSSTGLLTATFAPLGTVLGVVKKAFTGVLMGILPLIGIIFMVMGVVMLLVAVFDKGGGSLSKWLTDLPVLGDAFKIIQDAVDKVKGAFSGMGIDMETVKDTLITVGEYALDLFGPVFVAIIDGLVEAFENLIGNVSALWETLKSTVTLPELDGEGFVATLSSAMTEIVDLFFVVHDTIYDAVFAFITALAESGVIQGIVDGVMGIYNGFVTAWDAFTAILGDGEIMGFLDWCMDAWAGLIDFLVSSGIFAFIGELFAFVGEFIGFVLVLAAVIIAVTIKIIAFIYPYVAPYAKMFIAYLGIVVTIVIGVVRLVMAYIRFAMAFITGDFEAAGKHLESMGDIVRDVGDGVWKYVKMLINNLVDFVWPIMALFNKAIEVFNSIPGVHNLPLISKPQKLAMGGIATGPRGGYPVELHGTEAVVPLPDGKSIPVTIHGGGGLGGETTININVSGAHGDPRKIARMVGEEVGRLFKSRSRGSGFSRGV